MHNSFVFYKSWLDIISEEYRDSELQDKLISAIVRYGITGEKTYPSEKMFLRQCYAQIDSAIEKHNQKVEWGQKGGAPKGNQNAKKQPKTRYLEKKQAYVDLKQPNVNENYNSNVNENENYNSNDNDNSSSFGMPPVGAAASSEEGDSDAWEGGFQYI